MKPTIVALAVCAITACATGYHSYSRVRTGGFAESEIQPGVFQVSFRGNGVTSPERATDFAMLRGTELCLARGDRFMRVGNSQSGSHVVGVVPGSSTTTGSATAVASGNTASVYGSSHTTYMPAVPIMNTEAGITVACLKDQADDAWEATALAQRLRVKYEIEADQ